MSNITSTIDKNQNKIEISKEKKDKYNLEWYK